MEIKEQLITPAIAKKYLANNTNNRKIKENIVKRYVDDMICGRWMPNTAEMIKISKSSRILDGQHRLMAVVKSNISTKFHIAIDLDDSIFSVLDTGSARNACDSFLVQGVKNSNQVPSIINTYYNLKFGGANVKTKILTNKQLIERYMEKPEVFQETTRHSVNWYNAFLKVLSASHIGGFYLLFNDINPYMSTEFMNQLCTGVDVKNNTIHVLRNMLIKDKIANRKMNQAYKFALIIKTWNAFRLNQNPKRLTFDTERDLFPKAI